VPEKRDVTQRSRRTQRGLTVGAAQRVEHYEMAGYGTARSLARRLGENEIAESLQQTLNEEAQADKPWAGLSFLGHFGPYARISPYLTPRRHAGCPYRLLFLQARHFDFYSLNPHGMILRLYSRPIYMSINLCEFRTEKQNLRGIIDPEQQSN
jgi:Domain of unknown function (DUF892)